MTSAAPVIMSAKRLGGHAADELRRLKGVMGNDATDLVSTYTGGSNPATLIAYQHVNLLTKSLDGYGGPAEFAIRDVRNQVMKLSARASESRSAKDLDRAAFEDAVDGAVRVLNGLPAERMVTVRDENAGKLVTWLANGGARPVAGAGRGGGATADGVSDDVSQRLRDIEEQLANARAAQAEAARVSDAARQSARAEAYAAMGMENPAVARSRDEAALMADRPEGVSDWQYALLGDRAGTTTVSDELSKVVTGAGVKAANRFFKHVINKIDPQS